jgi:WD40 repeat protein
MTFENAKLLWSLPWDADWVTAVSFIGPRHVAAGNNLGQILLWELPEHPEPFADQTGKKNSSGKNKDEKPAFLAPPPSRQLIGQSNIINRLIGVEDRWLISASNDHTLCYWDINAEGGAPAKVVLNARTIDEITSNKSSGRKPPPPFEVEVKTQPPAKTIQGSEWIVGLSMSQDKSLLITGDDAGQVILWDRASGAEKKRWKVKGWAFAVAISPDNKQAAVSERYPVVFDNARYTAVKLWDISSGAVQHDLSKEFKDMQIAAAAYSPDGSILALGRGGEAAGLNGKGFLFDPATGKKLRELTPAHQDGVTDLQFHPAGRHLASCGRDTIVRIWSIPDGKLVKELGKPRGGQFKDWIHAISFSPDGSRLAAADMNGQVHVWSFEG